MRATDWALLVCCAALILAGPGMALQEATRAQEQKATYDITGQLPPVDASFRNAWRVPLTVLVVVTGVLATVTLLLVLVDASVRSVSGRLVALLLAGLALMYVTYYVDGLLFAQAAYAWRATTIVWLYPIAGVLVGGSTIRLAEIVETFGGRRRDRGEVVI